MTPTTQPNYGTGVFRRSTLHSTSVRCRIPSLGISSSGKRPPSLRSMSRSSSLRRGPRAAGALASTVTWTRPAMRFGTSSRSSREWDGSSSDSPRRFHCEPPELEWSALLVALRPVPPMVMMAEPFGWERALLEPPVLEGQAVFQRSRTRGPCGGLVRFKLDRGSGMGCACLPVWADRLTRCRC